MPTFSRSPHRLAPVLEIATLIAVLVLGVFLTAQLLAGRPAPGVAEIPAAAAEQLPA